MTSSAVVLIRVSQYLAQLYVNGAGDVALGVAVSAGVAIKVEADVSKDHLLAVVAQAVERHERVHRDNLSRLDASEPFANMPRSWRIQH